MAEVHKWESGILQNRLKTEKDGRVGKISSTEREREGRVCVFTESSHICIKLPDTSAAIAAFHYSGTYSVTHITQK